MYDEETIHTPHAPTDEDWPLEIERFLDNGEVLRQSLRNVSLWGLWLARPAVSAHIIANEIVLFSISGIMEDAVPYNARQREAMHEDDVRFSRIADGFSVDNCPIRRGKVLGNRDDRDRFKGVGMHIVRCAIPEICSVVYIAPVVELRPMILRFAGS